LFIINTKLRPILESFSSSQFNSTRWWRQTARFGRAYVFKRDANVYRNRIHKVRTRCERKIRSTPIVLWRGTREQGWVTW